MIYIDSLASPTVGVLGLFSLTRVFSCEESPTICCPRPSWFVCQVWTMCETMCECPRELENSTESMKSLRRASLEPCSGGALWVIVSCSPNVFNASVAYWFSVCVQLVNCVSFYISSSWLHSTNPYVCNLRMWSWPWKTCCVSGLCWSNPVIMSLMHWEAEE